MVQAIIVPPRNEPKRLSAYYQAEHLLEHFMAFMNHNNPHGFPPDEQVIKVEKKPIEELLAMEEGTIADVLMLITQHESLTLFDFKAVAHKVKDLIRPTVPKFKHGHALMLMSRLFGYYTYEAVTVVLNQRKDDNIPNLMYGCPMNEYLFSFEGKYVRPAGTREKIKALLQSS